MSADVRTFKAASMAEALDVVRREMGPDAVILHTRELPQPRILGFLRSSKDRVEITAGLGIEAAPVEVNVGAKSTKSTTSYRPNPPSQKPPLQKASNWSATQYEADGGVELDVGSTVRERIPSIQPSKRTPVVKDSDLADPPALLPPTNKSPGKTNSRDSARNLPVPESPAPTAFPPRRSPGEKKTEGIDRSVIAPLAADPDADQTDYTLENLVPRVAPPPRQQRPQSQILSRNDQSSAISEQLAGIRQLVERLGRKTDTNDVEKLPAGWMDVAEELYNLGIDETLSQEWIQRLQSIPEITPRDKNLVFSKLQTFIEADLNCSGPIQVRSGEQRVVALVGPTGVGKTTTIAKLAAHYSLREGFKTGLVTIDTFRIAAVEQLRTYAQIIDLPMEVATTPEELQRALERLRDLDLILIDTAGRSPRDAERIRELTDLLKQGGIDEIQLVLSLVSGKRSLVNTIERFAPAGITSVILSKLDETPDLSNIVHIARNAPWPMTYVTTGQEVPDDFAVARKSQLAKLILGLESLEELKNHNS